MLSLWHTLGIAPRSSYPVCQNFGSMGTFGARAEKRNVLRKKTAADVLPLALMSGLLAISAFFVGSATQAICVFVQLFIRSVVPAREMAIVITLITPPAVRRKTYIGNGGHAKNESLCCMCIRFDCFVHLFLDRSSVPSKSFVRFRERRWRRLQKTPPARRSTGK